MPPDFTVYTVTNENGCEGSDQVNVIENKATKPMITGITELCPTVATNLDAGLFTSYLWSTGETTSSIDVDVAGSYKVTVTDNNGCEGINEVKVIENETPEVQITGSLSFCPSSTTTLDAGNFTSYLWSTGETTQTVRVNTAGDYSVNVTDGNGCQGNDQVTIDEQANLQPQISGNLTICTAETTTLDAGVFESHLWSTGETTQTISVDVPGEYSVTVTDLDGCFERIKSSSKY